MPLDENIARDEVPERHTERRFSYAFARDKGLLFLGEQDGIFIVGVRESQQSSADSVWAKVEARRFLGGSIRLEQLPIDVFERRLSEIYSVEGISAQELGATTTEDLSSLAEGLPQTSDLLDSDDDAPVIRLINALISEAVKTKASDIHIEPFEHEVSFRLRVDGVLREVLVLESRMTPVVTSRVKVMARLDIAEKRLPQDGRISIALGSKTVDVRISTLPSRFGERVVMRILDKEQAQLDLDTLGMSPEILCEFKELLKRPTGIVLVTGPTGSGKTTTLYGALSLLNDPSRNILTVEDPVEYALDGVSQTQVNPKIGMTFAAGLRAILRQDPEIIMVGEIRDVETAQIAVQASLTGHMVLSTVHTNSAVGAITRLKDMGVESFLLASTVSGVMAQRLMRRLCPACKKPHLATPEERQHLSTLETEEVTVFEPVGCGRCNHSGYEGRIGIYELVVVDETIKRMIHDEESEHDLSAHAFQHSRTLRQSAEAHVVDGTTSIEEMLRVVRPDVTGSD